MLVVSVIQSPCSPNLMGLKAEQPPGRVQESHPVLDEITRLGPGPVARWDVIQALEPDMGGDRQHLRERRAEAFRKIDDLVRRGRLVKAGRHQLLTPDSRAAATVDVADNGYHPRRNAASRRRQIAIPRNRSVQYGTADLDGRAPEPRRPESKVIPANKIIVNCLPARPPQLELPKPNPTAQAISEAARSLGQLRGIRKHWSGFVNGERVWRNREIELPDGRRAYVYGALRGKVGWSLYPIGVPVEGDHLGNWGVAHASAVRLVRNPHAQVLGSRKAGVRERPSPAKAAAVRVNGTMPPRPGSRPRGRPPKASRSPSPAVAESRPPGGSG